MSSQLVDCPICSKPVKEAYINRHIDAGCVDELSPFTTQPQNHVASQPPRPSQVASFFQMPAARKTINVANVAPSSQSLTASATAPQTPSVKVEKRSFEQAVSTTNGVKDGDDQSSVPPPKKAKTSVALEKAAPLAERMRPRTLDQVHGQNLVGPNGVLRSLIESDRVPSMILWGGPGTGKTTIARLIAQTAGTRFVEINSTSTGVAECKRLFIEAKNELSLTGRKRSYSVMKYIVSQKGQQDVFLGPVEAGTITLIGATTENPSFKVVNALLSRCRTFTLAKLTDEDIMAILKRALVNEPPETAESAALLESDDHSLLHYLATFADGDARTALNLLSLALDLSTRPEMTIEALKSALTQTLVYDRAGDQHYDTISAFHKSVRGSDPDATLYYLARMLQSGEDPRYVARRMVVIASEDVGLADNSLLSLATATYQACETIGMPECRINLAHCAVALALAPKSTRSYRALNAAYAALSEPGIAGLPIPVHLRNAPTRLMKELGYGKEYKYNPHYLEGKVSQEYMPEKMEGRTFLEGNDLGSEIDPDLRDEKTSKGDTTKKKVEGDAKNVKIEKDDTMVEDTRTEEEMLLDPDGW